MGGPNTEASQLRYTSATLRHVVADELEAAAAQNAVLGLSEHAHWAAGWRRGEQTTGV